MSSGISVIIPMRDGARYVAEALDSIAAQDMPVERVVVVDDGSTDDGGRIAAGHRLRPVVSAIPPSGISAARNHGLGLVDTPFVAFLDSDDLWTPERCSVLMRALAADPQLPMAFGHVRQFVSPELPDELRSSIHVPDQPMAGLSAGAMLARRPVFDRVGPFDTDLRVADFVNWLLRAEHLGERYVVVPEVVLLRRHHGANTGRARDDDRRLDYVRAIRQHLHRRRGGPAPGSPGSGQPA